MHSVNLSKKIVEVSCDTVMSVPQDNWSLLWKWQARVSKNTKVRYFLAEVLGTVVFVFFAEGIMAQVLLGRLREAALAKKSVSTISFGAYLNYAIGSGVSYAVAMFIVCGVTNGHLNPAITLAAVLAEHMEWGMVPIYLVAQYIGGFLGASLVYSVHYINIRQYDSDGNITKRIFSAFPMVPNKDTITVVFLWDEAWITALMVLVYLAAYDPRGIVSTRQDYSFAPLFAGAGLTMIILSNGIVSSAAINPARDFTSRVLCGILFGSKVWSDILEDSELPFFWIPLILPYVGALMGTFLYAIAISLHRPRITKERKNTLRHLLELIERLNKIIAEELPLKEGYGGHPVDLVTTNINDTLWNKAAKGYF